MSTDSEPFEGCWYETEDGNRFLLVTYDEDEGLIEIQHEDGRVEELSLESWEDGDFSVIDSPGNTASFTEDAELDDEEDWRREEDEEEQWAEPFPDDEE